MWPAPAKINLMLHITRQRQDGYHELQTIFQFIDFSDELIFRPRSDGQIKRYSKNFSVAEDEDIIIRAAKTLQNKFLNKHPSAQPPGVDIQLKKNFGRCH